MNGMHKQRIIVIALAVLSFIAVFLNWVKPTNEAAFSNGLNMGYKGWLTLLLSAATVAISFAGDKTKALEPIFKYTAIALSAIITVVAISTVLDTIGLGLIILIFSSMGGAYAALYISDKKPDNNTPTLPNS
jgi:hypothetical protein